MKTFLNNNWQFQQHSDSSNASQWLAATVPGTTHQDLMAHGCIPDPHIGLHETDVQWVGERDWVYQLEFEVRQETLVNQVDLCFDGLDTFAQVWLNDQLILSSDNMFVGHRIPVQDILRLGQNQLRIVFESSVRHGKAREAQYGQRQLWNGDSSRLYVRKAQYHYGWDWGPTLMTAGIWRDVYLESYSLRIAEIHCPIEISTNLAKASFPVQLKLEGDCHHRQVQLNLINPNGQIIATQTQNANHHLEHTFEVIQPELWYPNGYGQQALYTLEAKILESTQILETQHLRLGVRKLELVQEALTNEAGKSFTFVINNIPIFCGGANWIPDDNFLPRISHERYQKRLTQARDANMVMIRVWGGGIYEDKVFYETCDELGLLVWQDFMFACGMYPAHAEFLESLESEAVYNLKRLRHHPSLVLWCGNNEDYAIAESLSCYDPSFQGDFINSAFPAREIYERKLPQWCTEFDPTRPYWQGSPYSGQTASDDQTVGDRHTWEIWHGAMAAHQEYPTYQARFVSEFGMQSAPSIHTIQTYCPLEELNSSSRTFEHHNKAQAGPRRLATYLSDMIQPPRNLEEYVYHTQLLQAQAMISAYRNWRRRWQGIDRRYVSGALIWQLNDCWGVTSWAIIDSQGRPKPAYYAIKRELAPIALGLTREQNGVQVWIASSSLETKSLTLEYRVFDLLGNEIKTCQLKIQAKPNQTTEHGLLELPAEHTIIAARLLEQDFVVARTALFPEPYKYYNFPKPEIKITVLANDQIKLSTSKPVKGVWLETKNAALEWEDNMLDLMPNEDRILHVKGLGTSVPSIKYLGSL
jgi:beta-mannosidase